MKPILFLDFDGVLNSNTSGLEADKVAFLNTIVINVDCEVILSTAWRIAYTQKEIENHLDQAGYLGKVDGRTPNLGCERHVKGGWERCSDAHRGHEILTYLEERFGLDSTDWPVFVILDDSSDMHPLKDKLVHTKWNVGLELAHVREAITRLRGWTPR
jgi:hypothetical protein